MTAVSRPGSPGTPLAAWARFFEHERDGYVLGLLRLALSLLLLLNTARLLSELMRRGYFGNYFHLPLLPESWLPSPSGYALILGLQLLAALAAFFGLWPRPALFVAASTGVFVIALDRLQYHNNRYALLLLAFLLAFTACDRSFVIARRPPTLPPAARMSPSYSRRLLQLQVSLVYLGSAVGKLLDPDWRGGRVLFVRFAQTAEFWAARGIELPRWSAAAVSSALFASIASKIAISTELFIALGLWWPRTRRLALWVGVLFHCSIELSARVELFSYTMLSSYLAFVVPELRERRFEFDPRNARARALARALGLLDWCARFKISERTADESASATAQGQERAAFAVTNRAGQTAQGVRGAAYLAEALPALFPLWLPLALWARLRRQAPPERVPGRDQS